MNNILFDFGPIKIYWYSLLILTGIIIGYNLALKEAKRIGLSTSYMSDLCFYTIIFSIIGARVYYVIFKFSDYKNNLLDIFKVWEGGLAIYGGVIAGIIFIIYYARKKEKSIIKTMDILAPSLILGQAIGRWGNFFNQEAYGPVVTRSFLENLHIPNFIIEGMYINGSYYQPTFLYESIWCLIGFVILLIIRYCAKNLKTGTIVSLYFIFYGIGRFYIESLRSDSLYLASFRVSQIVSLILIIVGIIGLILSFIKKDKYRKNIKEAKDDIKI